MKKILHLCLGVWVFSAGVATAQITKLQTFRNNTSPAIGVFQGIAFREAGFSGLTAIQGTNGKEFWTVSDRGVNIDLAATSNPVACRNAYDKMYVFPTYAPKIHRVRLIGDSIQILQTISIKRPNGTGATGLLNPAGLGSTTAEFAQFDTLVTCTNFASKTTSKDVWGIDSEAIAVDKDGNFWISEEGGPTIWKVDPNGKVLKRFTPYANLVTAEPEDVLIDTVFKYRKNNRGFEGLTITPNGKVYAMIQSPILYPSKSAGESTRIHRLLEIDPTNNTSKVYAYLNDGPQGGIRFRDWKIGDLSAINDTTFLVIEAAQNAGTDVRKIYKISIVGASTVSSGLVYTGNKSLEQLVDATTLGINGITPVKKTLFLDLLANGWPVELEKTEGLAIINDSTIAVGNDNDYGQVSPNADGIATPTTIVSHIITFGLKGGDKLVNFVPAPQTFTQGITGPSSSKAPYLLPLASGVVFKSVLTAGDKVGGYKMAGTPDGSGAFDNGDGTFTYLVNHEFTTSDGVTRAHGSKGAFVSKWIVKKSDLSVVSGADLIQNVNLWNGTGYTTYNSSNPSTVASFGRFCSGILPVPSAYFNTVSGFGTTERIFMNGEENGNEGRGFAHIVTGTNAGTTWELPYLGKFSWENAIPSPKASDKTIVVGTDDSSPVGQVYFYIGNKTNTGTEIEKAGLVGGNLYGVSVSGMFVEAGTTLGVGNGFAFSLANLGNASTMTGAQINTASDNLGVTKFLRPEDGDWDPSNPNDFYFNTTNSVNNPSRLWRLRFTDINNPELGGTATAVLDGTEGQQMLDNMTPDQYGNIILVEDVGNNAILGKVYQYNVHSDKLKPLAQHNPSLFTGGTANPSFITQDEEASAPIDMENILGKGWFLIVDQIHNKVSGEQVEGGQLLAFFNPDTYNATKGAVAGPSSSKESYLLPLAPGVVFKSVLTAGDVIGGYKMAGTPDGSGAFDNGNGTFTYLVNHEFTTSDGVTRAHGSKGAFVSKWIVKKSDLSVVSGADLIQNVNLWNGTGYTTYNSSNPSTVASFGRFCSGILPVPSAYFNTVSGFGTTERIFMNGEENGNEGRGFAHIVTGTNAGTTWELPYLGKFSWENAIPSPKASDKTIVAGTDDSSPVGQVYFYIGNKNNTGTEIEKAGLVGGNLYGVSVSGMFVEAGTTLGVGNGFAFSLANLGNVSTMTGAQINTASDNLGVTKFLRPEDGDWDPSNPNDFYFNTTNAVNNPSRLWRLRFTDINNPELGGTATAVLDGTEGQQMLDNMTIDNYGHIILVEDVGNNAILGKVYQYTIATDQLKALGQHNPTLFSGGTTNPSFITQDEEASAPIDMENILGKGWFLIVDQIHNKVAGEQVEGGQLVAFFNPDTYTATTPGGVITVVETSNAAATNVNIYPNPTESDVTVSLVLENDDHIVINVADIQGKSVQNVVNADFAKGEQNIAVKTSNLSTGIYIVEVSTSKGTSRTKVVVIR